MVDVSYYFICVIISQKNFTRTHRFISLLHSYRYFFIFVKKTLMYTRIQRSVAVRSIRPYKTRRSRDQRHHFEQLSLHLYPLRHIVEKLIEIIPSMTHLTRRIFQKKRNSLFPSLFDRWNRANAREVKREILIE